MALPIQTIINTHEALSDWKFTAQEANQVIAGVWEGVIGMIVITTMMGIFNMVVGSGNPGGESRNPKQLNASGFSVEQTVIGEEVIDSLEHTWHRIDSDMSVRMQEALGILKEVMSYRYEQPAVVVWDNSDLVGIAVYETIRDKDLDVQDTHISELASFTYEPGVGKLLVEKIIEIAGKEGSDAVTASYGPGKRGFYERSGFVKDYRYPEAPTLMMYKMSSEIKKGGTAMEEELSVAVTEDQLGQAAMEGVMQLTCPYCGSETPAEPDADHVYCLVCDRRFKIDNPYI